ncbi:hypothetical protein GLOIN_2v1544527, partial [Rhizophagus irregularis DAOM 181602=DAOM 197198]
MLIQLLSLASLFNIPSLACTKFAFLNLKFPSSTYLIITVIKNIFSLINVFSYRNYFYRSRQRLMLN